MSTPRWSGLPDDADLDVAEQAARQLFRGAGAAATLSPVQRAGVLERVVERRSAGPGPWWLWRGWRVAGPAMAAALLLVFLVGRGEAPRPGPGEAFELLPGRTVRLSTAPGSPALTELQSEGTGPTRLGRDRSGRLELRTGTVRVGTGEGPASLRAGGASVRAGARTRLQVAVTDAEISVTCFAGEARVELAGQVMTVKEHFELRLPVSGAGRPRLRALPSPAPAPPAAPAPAIPAAPPAPPEEPPAPPVRLPAVARPAPAPPIAVAPEAPAPSPLPAPTSPAAPPPSPLGDEADALATALQLLPREPARALELLEQQRRRFPAGALRLEVRRARLDALLRLGRRPAALELLDAEVLAGTRALAGTVELLTVRGELRAGAGRCSEAEQDFTSVLGLDDASTASTWRERALFGRASCRARRHDRAGARADLETYLERHPRGALADRARRSLATLR